MQNRTRLALATIAVMLGGCATVAQQPIGFSHDAYTVGKPARIGVVMTPLPKIDTQFPGAYCLLCMAAASMANSALTTYTHTLPYEDLPKLKTDAADRLRKSGLDATVIAEDLNVEALPKNHATGPNIATRDFTSLKAKYNVDKLLVIDITLLGFVRTYSAYIPTSDPKGEIDGKAYIVDLTTNTYDWYHPVSVVKSTDSNWHEPPKFPGLTNAYFQAIETGKDDFLKPLGQ